MKIYAFFIGFIVLGMASTSCVRHTTCSAYGTSIQKIEKNQDEVHAAVDYSIKENI